MSSGGGAMSLLFHSFFVNSVFPTPHPPEKSIEKRCFSETSILYRSLYVNGMLKVPLKVLRTYSYPYNSLLYTVI